MGGTFEYALAVRAVAAYTAVTAVVRQRLCVVVHSDVRYRTVTFRPWDAKRSDLTVYAAVLDTGHGLSKLVLTARDDRDGSIVDLADYSARFFADTARRLRSQAGDTTDALVLGGT
jgi:hypothetical protein